jgi:methionine aminopeptidase
LKKHLIDGNKAIINKETFDQKVDDHEFQVNEVYALDVIMSTGEGKPKEVSNKVIQSDLRCTVYKRALERNCALKTNHGRSFFAEVQNRFPSLGFSLNSFENEVTAKLGVSESIKHDLLNAYPVLTEKKGELVAQFKITVMILQGSTITITGLPIDLTKFKTENAIKD